MTQALSSNLLALVLPHFGYALTDCKVASLGNGLINGTYLVQTNDKTFVLQCLNKQVFNQPEQVTNNTDLISAHLNKKYLNQQYALTPIYQLRSTDNKNHVTVQGQYWRCLNYIEHSYTIESVTNLTQAHDVASAFAQFTQALSDFDNNKLTDIIPQFHNLSMRIKQCDLAVGSARNDRLIAAKDSLKFIKSQQIFIDEVTQIIKNLPLRVTHNDTKINNLLFSEETNKPIAVIDLDTCMTGYLMHDFGDMVRSCCASAAEESTDVNDMTIDFDMIATLTKAYIAGFNGNITTLEQKSLLLGIKLMPFMLSIRFLTDFLNGDKYFKTYYAKQNLVRAKSQLHLYKLFCQQEPLLAKIVLSEPTLNVVGK